MEGEQLMNKRKRLLKRILSFVLAVNLIVANVFFDGMIPFSDLFNTGLTASAAYSPVITDPNSSVFDRDSNGAISLNYSNFKDYAYYYHENAAFAALHKDDKVTLTFGTTDTVDSDYIPLGTSDNPFNGSLLFTVAEGVTTYTLKTYQPLFDYISDNAVIGGTVTLNLFNMKAGNFIFANHVKDADTTPGNGTARWNIELDHRLGTHSADTSESYAGVIGEMMSGARVNLSFTDYLSTAVESDGDTGMICGVMDEDSSLSLSLTRTNAAYNVKSTGSGTAAGALVGRMAPGAALELVKIPEASMSSSVTATGEGSYAGGLVGWANDASVTVVSGGITVGSNVTKVNVIPVKGTIKAATGGAGGLFGYYKNSSESTFDLKNYNITTTVYAKNCGGVFGVLDNEKGTSETAVSFTVKNTNNAGTVSVTSGSAGTYADNGCFGGVAGKYVTDDLTNSLVLDGFSVTSTAGASFASFGGVIGLVDSAAYVQTAGTVSATSSGTNRPAYFGGLIGATSDAKGVFVNLGSFTLNTGSEMYKGGGLVGLFNNGVLRLSGTTDLTKAQPASAADCGQLVGKNDNVLTYAASGWTFKRCNGSTVDDLGTWGEVVRIANIEDATNGVLTLDSANHTVTIKAAQTSMSTPSDFVKTALNIQLNQGSDYDCLQFVKDSNDVVDTSNTRTTLLASTSLSFGADISLAGTGITGFMRDGGDSVGTFTGTLAGGSKTVTLAIGEKYGETSAGAIIGSSTDGEGLGQIYRHPYNGLFAYIGNGTAGTGTVNSLTIDGNVNVRDKINGMNIGGIAAVSKGNTSLSGITASQTINYGEPSSVTGSEAAGKNIGGLIGLANGTDNGTIAITGTNTINTTFNISDNFKSWNSLGAFIGKVASPKFTINIAQGGSDSLTVSHTMSGTFTAGGNTDGGGLIGYITSIPSTSSNTYSDRKVNIKNLDFNNCTIINKASTNAGGFLGYAWLDTDTTIDGLTVTDGTITNTTPNVGIMCYEATGRWTVDNLTVTKMSLSGGAGTSLGMLVNKAYSGSNGLYLDVLNSGYTLTDKSGSTGISLPNTLGVYDELAVYSAADVIKGTNGSNGAGVISINMNTNREGTKGKIRDYNISTSAENGTGTYQNQLTTASSTALASAAKYPNANSRYYYNLDVMDKDKDKAQDIMLWSVNKYAADNISSLFVSSDTPFNCESATNATLSNYSYYPVYSVSGLTLKNINIDFGYSGIYAVESNSTFNTDSYNRNPGEQNQHYLMQSGLFINSGEGATLTLNTVKLSGDFLENSTYQGALISGTAKGGITVNGLVLDGITPKYNNSGTVSTYNTGYLLVNKVNRADASKASIQLTLQNISTSDKYTVSSTTAQVSKSLFGDVYGPDMGINISSVRIDARSTSGAVTGVNATDLNRAYNTVNSIFTTATLFNSIKTSQTATMIYNYEITEDWGDGESVATRNVTYGREVSESVEYEDKENKYNNSDKYTDPTSNSHTSEPEYDFSSWRPYVAQVYAANQTPDAQGCYYRELKVNVPASDTSLGCGTYNDPYIIDSGVKLEAFAYLINSASNTSYLPSVQLPKTLHNGIAENTTGARWCEGKSDHTLYTYNEETGFYEATVGENTVQWSVENVRLYLSNAYYSITSSSDDTNGNVVLSSNYLGLGGTDASGKFAFRGVIVGSSRTIINNSQNPLVKVSNGCVVKGITVNQNVDVTVQEQTNTGSADAYFGYDSHCRYYGGIIGEIMGGDNIIDNSYVSYGGHTVTLSGTYGTIVPVGGYVGVIVYGGLIFKNMTATDSVGGNSVLRVNNSGLTVYYNTNTSNNLATDTADAKAAIYVNPIVGRVINGYAVNESTRFSTSENGTYHDDANNGAGTTRTDATIHTLKNGKKHYSIADINKNETNKLNVTAVATTGTVGNINVPNAQALFVLSLITQSTAGTATDSALGAYSNSLAYGSSDSAVYGMSHNADYSDVGTGTALIDDDPDTDEDERNVTDYQKIAVYDTANNSSGNAPIPYIIKYYTEGSTTTGTSTRTETRTRTVTETVTEDVTHYSTTKYQETSTVPTGTGYLIRGHRNTNEYLTSIRWDNTNKRNYVLRSTKYYTSIDDVNLNLDETKIKNATEVFFEKNPTNSTYCIYYIYEDDNNVERRKYLNITNVYYDKDHGITDTNIARGNVCFSDDIMYFTVEYQVGSKGSGWTIHDSNNRYVNYAGDSTNFCAWTTQDEGTYFDLYEKNLNIIQVSHEVTHEEEYEVTITEYSTTHNYPARCVTNTAGYYNITLTGTDGYQLPDSFRGLGCVGMYDSALGKANLYPIKLNTFDGNEKTIDVDIFLNKFNKDNYFDKLHKNTDQDFSVAANHTTINGNTNTDYHGIGLFDSVIMKDSSSKFSDFELTGSVRTAIYNYSYDSRGECHDISADNLFLSVGGVCGWATNNAVNVGFEGIDLNDLTVCGTNHFGGLLGYSGLKSPVDNKDTNSYMIWIKECTADNISIKATAGTTVGDARQARCGMGAFVGKVQEGAVYIYGTADEDDNPNPDTDYSEVKIKSYELTDGNTLNYNMSAGGLVGFAGNGCKIYDMRVSSKSSAVTIGGNWVNFAGGIVGGMQSSYNGGKTGVAVFKNCIVQNINVNGNYAGGIYGGKWDSNWTTYSITMDNCQMVGTPGTHNTIFANDSFGDNSNTTANHVAYAGGLIGKLYPYTNLDDNNKVTYNVLIKDCIVKDYDITAANTATSYAGGFIGYASSVNNSVTCYMHDSSVENCKIGASGNYAGGVVGRIIQKDNNEILGYNIKLDTITTDAGNKMGTWIGSVPNDSSEKKTSIQLTGMAIYGNGFTKNIGNGATIETASFVFADYDGTSEGTTTNNVTTYPTRVSAFNNTYNVEMPKYPYININPQSAIGTGEIISGDGAVLYGKTIDGYSGKTGDKTMAARIYADLSSTSNTRRYTTFADSIVYGNNKIQHYLQQTEDSEGDRISTWENEMGSVPTGVSDFAMIVIANESTEETTALINRYIQLVTNTTTDYSISSDYYDVVPSACVYNDSSHKFEVTNGTASISYSPGATASNAFTVVRAGADSLSANKFTLLDVQFKDPFDTDNVAYHLYIPVYVKRSISVTFSSTALSGTDALASNYIPGLSTQGMLIESLDTWFTTYIRYTYGISDLQALLDSGMLGWNGSKQVALNFMDTATGTSLPGNTKLVLIDPNGNADRAYYASGSELGGNTFSLSKFHKSYSGGAAFAEQKLGNIIGGSVKVTESTGCYDLSTASDYDIKVGNNYYKYVGSGNGGYKITAESAYNEDYYISMLFPSGELVYLFDVNSPRSLPGNMVTYVDPSSAIEQILLGDLYEYEITRTVVTPEDQVITDTNNTITVNMTSKVRLKSTNRGLYASYLNSNNVKLYHADVITLNRYYAGGSDTTLSGYGSIDVTACVVEDGSGNQTDLTNSVEAEVPSNTYIVVSTGDIRSQVTAGIDSDSYQGAAITQTVEIPFNNIDEEFPSRPPDQEGTSQYGVSVSGSSNISYDSDDVVYSSKKVPFSDSKRYYIENANTATLKYEANDELDKYDSVGAASYNYSHLGNNGLDRSLTCKWPNGTEGMPISATAKYNANKVTNYDDAATIVYTLTLYKKTDTKENGKVTGVQYVQVPIEDYLKNVKVYGGDTAIPLTKNQSSDNMRYVYSQAKEAANEDEKVFTIGTYYEVVTGPTFHDFANYRVVLEVQLRNSSGTVISNSTQNDYIVYTNAKIYPEVIQQ